ncbi:MAG: carboxypeptidase regulatory-like domain-containing protein, partial [Candidatus Hydrogenedentota bacterium]
MILSLAFAASSASAHTLSGTIFGGSNPLPNTIVTLLDNGTQAVLDTDTTDVNGDYSFTVSDGTYDLDVAPPGGSGYLESVVQGILVSGG